MPAAAISASEIEPLRRRDESTFNGAVKKVLGQYDWEGVRFNWNPDFESGLTSMKQKGLTITVTFKPGRYGRFRQGDG